MSSLQTQTTGQLYPGQSWRSLPMPSATPPSETPFRPALTPISSPATVNTSTSKPRITLTIGTAVCAPYPPALMAPSFQPQPQPQRTTVSAPSSSSTPQPFPYAEAYDSIAEASSRGAAIYAPFPPALIERQQCRQQERQQQQEAVIRGKELEWDSADHDASSVDSLEFAKGSKRAQEALRRQSWRRFVPCF